MSQQPLAPGQMQSFRQSGAALKMLMSQPPGTTPGYRVSTNIALVVTGQALVHILGHKVRFNLFGRWSNSLHSVPLRLTKLPS
jgi:hypothetical protein